MKRIILFDSDCLLCNRSVQFIIERDPQIKFKFASIKSKIGKGLIEIYQIPSTIDSIIYIEGQHYYIQSSAILHICKNLNGIWKYLYFFSIIPTSFRNFLYDIISQNRHKWFGRSDNCFLSDKDRFL